MDVMQFTQVIPRLRVLETKLLDKAKIERMVDSSSAQDVLKVLQETDYGMFLGDVKKPEDYEIILSKELNRVYDMLYKICPSKEIIDIMAAKYDYHNIKVLIKGKILNKDFSQLIIPVGIEDVSKLKYAIENEYYRDINTLMRECIEKIEEDYSQTKDPQRVDIIADRYLFIHINSIVKKVNHKPLEKYIDSLIDLTNIKTLLRVKKQGKGKDFFINALIPGGRIDKDKLIQLLNESAENIPTKLSFTNYEEILKEGIAYYIATGSVSLFEMLVDNYIMNIMKDAKYVPFGAEPVIAYIYAKENEIKQIRTIMVGKLNNITGEVIKERLRDAYV